MDAPAPDSPTDTIAPDEQVRRDWPTAIALLSTLAIALLLALAFEHLGTRSWLIWGAVGWGAGVVVKGAAAFQWSGPMERLGPRAKGLAEGLLSAVTELGVMAGLLLVSGVPGGAVAALAIGVGAGCLEAVLLGVPAVPQALAAAPHERVSWLLRLAFPIERLLVAMPLHVGARALVAASAMGAGAWPAAAAVACFTLVDGLPGYGEAVGWRWTEARTLGRYYALAGAAGWVSLGLAIALLLTR